MGKLSEHKVSIVSSIGTLSFGVGAYFQPYLAIAAGVSMLIGVCELAIRKRRAASISPRQIEPVIHPDPQSNVVNVIIQSPPINKYESNPNIQFLQELSDNANVNVNRASQSSSAEYEPVKEGSKIVTFMYSEKRLMKYSNHFTDADIKEFRESLHRVKDAGKATVETIEVSESKGMAGPRM